MNMILILTLPFLINSSASNNSPNGNCVSGRINFSPERIAFAPTANTTVDYDAYDMTIDYGAKNANFGPDGVTLSLIKDLQGKTALGIRMSTTRTILYGKISARLAAIPEGGAITTFITMSDRGDEIDWEIVGANKSQAETNIFYKGIPEYGVHGGKSNVKGSIADYHIYTIDWKSDELIWSIDNAPVRRILKNSSTSPMTPAGERWYPSTPSQIQISVWDGGSSSNPGTVNWAGGPINWGDKTVMDARYEYIDIQCYNDKNELVESWPPSNKSITFKASSENVTGTSIATLGIDGKPIVTSSFGNSSFGNSNSTLNRNTTGSINTGNITLPAGTTDSSKKSDGGNLLSFELWIFAVLIFTF